MASSRTLMALAIAATMVVELAMAANYTVGGSDGWEIGTDLQSWTSSNKFNVGDVLLFVYTASHDVLEVEEADFRSCSASSPIQKYTGGSTSITLLTSGKRYFICGIPGHCLAGMKVEIDTLATSSPSPLPSSTDTPPASPPQETPSSPPPSSTLPPPTSPPASPPKAAPKPPAKSPPGPNASPPAPPTEATPPSSAPPTVDPATPPFPFDQPLNPSASPTPPPSSSAYKCSFRVHFSVGFSFVVMLLLSL